MNKMLNLQSYVAIVTCAILISTSTVQSTIWCYSCISNQPGCSENELDWFIHKAVTCPKEDDKCVKIIERKNGDVMVTRDCLSRLVPVRPDMPGDKYEGCRSASFNPKISNNLNNGRRESDFMSKSDDVNTTFCFCEFDHWCNGQNSDLVPKNSLILALSMWIFMLIVYQSNYQHFSS